MFNALSESTFNEETLQRRIAQVERENAQLHSRIKVIERQNMVLEAKAEKVKYDKKDLYSEKAKLKKAKAKFAIELEKEEEREKELLQSQEQDSIKESTSTTEASEICDITTEEETTSSSGDDDNEKAPISPTSETKAASESKRDTKNPWGTSKANKPSKLNKDAPVFKPGVQQHSHDSSSAEDATEATSSFDESMSSNDAEQHAHVMLSPTGELMITPLPHSYLYAYTAAAEYFQMDDDVPPPPNNDGYYDGQFVDETA